MRLEEEFEKAFTPEQLAELGRMLHLKSKEEIDGAALGIFGVLLFFSMSDDANRRIPDRTKAKRKLDQIARATKKLIGLLNDREIADCGTGKFESKTAEEASLAKLLYRRPLWDDDDVKLRNLIDLLINVEVNSRMLRDNEEYFRIHYRLPKLEDVNRDFAANLIWPRLFKFYEMAGNRVAATPGGPTMRFIRLVHDVAGLAPPSEAALKTAVGRWANDPARHREEAPPWHVEARS